MLLGHGFDDDLLTPARGPVMRNWSPTWSARCGFPDWPLRSTLPPRQAFCASLRVLNRHATSSQTSRRTSEGAAGGGALARRFHRLNQGGFEAR